MTKRATAVAPGMKPTRKQLTLNDIENSEEIDRKQRTADTVNRNQIAQNWSQTSGNSRRRKCGDRQQSLDADLDAEGTTRTPSWIRVSGLCIQCVPGELVELNWMESKLIRLGISFTTCVNLYTNQQEFTRGNAVNYWNNVTEMTHSLPRPLSRSGIVLLRSKNSKGEHLV
ncbi:unnamed protein product [Phytophthora lilii]|uniref:Unnamed protein product n=1 Tax=Phytophthora lilii TaxID=2077276 RepID=A0A9W6YL61_9STRA|nr:unnamed protein product [Phytophthora lilii]